MLQIRKEQSDSFSVVMRRKFNNRMVLHIQECFPEHYEKLREDNTRELVDIGVDKAATYDIVSERDVCKFIDLMLGFGVDFDENPEYPWASDILNDETLNSPSIKTNKLYDAAMEHLEQSPEFQSGGA